jgi:hypothetical protein
MITLSHFAAIRRAAAGVCLFVATVAGHAATQVLYDPAVAGAANDNPLLDTPRWFDGVVPGSTTFSAQGANITQTSNSGSAGYSNYSALLAFLSNAPLVNPAFPSLDRTLGYRLTFGLDLNAEDHSGNSNRAGFSVTLIGNDKKGIEIGFQSSNTGGSVFAQNDSGSPSGIFSAGESASTTLGFSPNLWNLDVQGNTYSLGLVSGGGAVLAGALRDYSNYVGNGQNAYRTPNFLFLGDNTSSARADFVLSYAAITTPVPEPSAYILMFCGLTLLGAMVRRQRPARR